MVSGIFLVAILVLLPGQQQPVETIRAGLITASSPEACQVTADKRAAEYRERNADIVQRLGAKVVGVCVRQQDGAT